MANPNIRPVLTLDLQQSEQRDLLFFHSFCYPEVTYWDPNEVYTADNRDFRVAVPIAKIPRKPEKRQPLKDDPENFRYEVLEPNRLGGPSSYGVCRRSLMTLRVNGNHLEIKREYTAKKIYDNPNEKPKRVIKRQKKKDAKAEHPMLLAADPDGVKDLVVDGENGMIVMPYHHGVTVDQILKADKPGLLTFMTEEQRYDLGIRICEAIEEGVIQLGLLHLDLKPHNLILTPEQKIKIIDWGFSCKGPKGPILKGTRPYMASEMWGKFPAFLESTSACDAFSFGIILSQIMGNSEADLLKESRAWIANAKRDIFGPRTFPGLLKHQQDLLHQHLIRALIQDLTLMEPTHRCTIPQAKARLIELAAMSPYRKRLEKFVAHLESYPWEVHRVWCRSKIHIPGQGEKKVPAHIAKMWEDGTALLRKYHVTLADYQAYEAAVLESGKAAKQNPGFFTFLRQESTQRFYDKFDAANDVETLLERFNV